ncbi:MAG: HAMP domain-containing histidine kinase [Candidatus Eremiobacteraeota bacterium]|nr:HAMP domain-containing histidine kinase [Candidatus Eremiobacteraeota bacterium]MBV8366045.1 HAMP domain-containing histidine kinase [Candidatus Eremiobacteraeota bacterium]
MSDQEDKRLSELIHEMRNQLSIAKANLEAFIDGKMAPTAKRLESVVQTLHHLDELIKDLRVLHPSLDAGRSASPARLQEINVCDLLQREFSSLEAVANDKHIALTVFRCPHPAAACQRFYGDPTRVGQIVKNVLLNAIRHTPPGGTVTVDCARRADELQVTVSDQGAGIAREDADRVFERGYRASGAPGSGSGLGLAIVKELVEAHGGSVRLDSEAPAGARFVIRLPGKLPTAT